MANIKIRYFFGAVEMRSGEYEHLEKGVCYAHDQDTAIEIFKERWTPDSDEYILKEIRFDEITEAEFEILNKYI